MKVHLLTALFFLAPAAGQHAANGICHFGANNAVYRLDTTTCFDNNFIFGLFFAGETCADHACDGSYETSYVHSPSAPPPSPRPPTSPPAGDGGGTISSPPPPMLPPVPPQNPIAGVTQADVSEFMHRICRKKCNACSGTNNNACVDSDRLAFAFTRGVASSCTDPAVATMTFGYCDYGFRIACPATSAVADPYPTCMAPEPVQSVGACESPPDHALGYWEDAYRQQCAYWGGVWGGSTAVTASGQTGTCSQADVITNCSSLPATDGYVGCAPGMTLSGGYYYSAEDMNIVRSNCPEYCGTCPPAPPPTCASWCNAYTCDAESCSGCDTCSTLADGQYCSSWCNDYTCSLSHCSGCTNHCTNHPWAPRTYCASWCNVYTAGSSWCANCAATASYNAGTYCASWCNSWTGSSSYCTGCVAASM